ncbi:hypothetical protein F5887DRAFT_914707 [Amanita rubescens]|nr:hypothetical protein F5887DRAFT_914707 [Amanita rubescens]
MSLSGGSATLTLVTVLENPRTLDTNKSRTLTFDSHAYFSVGNAGLGALSYYHDDVSRCFDGNDEPRAYFVIANVALAQDPKAVPSHYQFVADELETTNYFVISDIVSLVPTGTKATEAQLDHQPYLQITGVIDSVAPDCSYWDMCPEQYIAGFNQSGLERDKDTNRIIRLLVDLNGLVYLGKAAYVTSATNNAQANKGQDSPASKKGKLRFSYSDSTPANNVWVTSNHCMKEVPPAAETNADYLAVPLPHNIIENHCIIPPPTIAAIPSPTPPCPITPPFKLYLTNRQAFLPPNQNYLIPPFMPYLKNHQAFLPKNRPFSPKLGYGQGYDFIRVQGYLHESSMCETCTVIASPTPYYSLHGLFSFVPNQPLTHP